MRTTTIGFIALAVGSVVGAFNMYAAWQHNPQCEFHCEGTIVWGNWLLVGASWLVVGAAGTLLAALSVRVFVSKLGSKHENT